jgi:hypothetical protein
MNIEKREGKFFNLKPEMTLAMKLAATFAITYYGLLLLFEIVTVVFRRYYFDTYYFNQGEMSLGSQEFIVQIIQLALSIILVFSLIQVFRKKNNGKPLFVGASLFLIIFQLLVTGFVPWMKYALETLLILIIAPIRVKKKIKMKDGKLTMETVEESPEEESKEEETIAVSKQSADIQETINKADRTENLQEVSEASSQPAEQP